MAAVVPLLGRRADQAQPGLVHQRRIVIERARRKKSLKRAVQLGQVNLEEVAVAILAADETLLLVNEALEKVEQKDAAAAQLAKLRFFAKMTNEESGKAMRISERTAKRYWTFGRAWLFLELRGPAGR